ncbi:MAG: virB8 family protein [Asticcacaulis sp.]|uniref:virB8 family protein n=1 Tax=Asticcacaulis sp. TaxID=1872648 RepID=UPI003F7C88AA
MKTDMPSYYAKSASWAQSEAEGAQRARKRAWIVAGAAALIALAEAVALVSLTPLKSTRVVPVLVDRQTGFVEVLNKDGSQTLRADAALIRSMLAQYVAAREEFDITTLSADYHKVMLWSGGQARSAYAAVMPAQNPQSPLSLYPRSAVVSVNIETVSKLGPRTALVRFTTTRMDQGNASSTPSYYAAVITYQFTDAPMRAEDRLINPLGFQVMHYERSDEAAPPPQPAPGYTMDIPLGAPDTTASAAVPDSVANTEDTTPPAARKP